MDVVLRGQPVTRASIRAATKPPKVKLNGVQIEPTYDTDQKMITLRLEHAGQGVLPPRGAQ